MVWFRCCRFVTGLRSTFCWVSMQARALLEVPRTSLPFVWRQLTPIVAMSDFKSRVCQLEICTGITENKNRTHNCNIKHLQPVGLYTRIDSLHILTAIDWNGIKGKKTYIYASVVGHINYFYYSKVYHCSVPSNDRSNTAIFLHFVCRPSMSKCSK